MSAGGGEPLPASLRATFESRFGHDFQGVRVHTDARASAATAALGARAFTVGDHVFFGAGEYQPTSTQGSWLIAHELAHVVQQGAAPIGVRRRPIVTWEIAGKQFYQTRSGDVIELPEDMTAEQVAKLEDDAIARRDAGSPSCRRRSPSPRCASRRPSRPRRRPPKPRPRRKRDWREGAAQARRCQRQP